MTTINAINDQELAAALGSAVLADVMLKAGNGSAPVSSANTYGEKYAGVRESIIANAEDSAKIYTDLAGKHDKIAEGYRKLAGDVRDAGVKAADDYVRSLSKLDRSTAILSESE